jgi:hypothetical protein
MNPNLKSTIEELIQEIEKELDEATASGNVAGYNVPTAFSNGSSKNKKRKKKISTQFGMKIVGKIDEDEINEAIKKITSSQFKKLQDAIRKVNPRIKIKLDSSIPGGFEIKIPDDNKWELHTDKVNSLVHKITGDHRNGRIIFEGNVNEGPIDRVIGGRPYEYVGDGRKGKAIVSGPMKDKDRNDIIKRAKKAGYKASPGIKGGVIIFIESINEAKVKRPVNRWLELKNDETMHPHKKMAMGLKELKYQLAETEKFFKWYGKIKSMNELDSQNYWKRTNKHIYKIKERLVNIAKTLKEIEN